MVDRYADISTRLKRDLNRSANPQHSISEAASSLWKEACTDVQTAAFDDRALYWGRLLLHKALSDHELEEFSPIVERLSRNLDSLQPSSDPHAIVTGFDPFGLNSNLQQCNPSGAFALALNETRIGNLQVKSMIFPVRYADFDDFCVENALEPVLKSDSTALVLTVSMGRDAFDLERFPANCRGASQPDNQDIAITQLTEPFDPPLNGPSFLEFSLPAQQMLDLMSSESRSRISDNRHITTVEDGAIEAISLSKLEGKNAISGAGGNFLSNEISYRALKLQSELGTAIPMGHIHVPRISGYNEHRVRQDFSLFKEVLSALVSLVSTPPNLPGEHL